MLQLQPLRNNQFKSLTWGTELLYSDNRYDVTSPSGDSCPAAPSAPLACTRISLTSSIGSGPPGSCLSGWRMHKRQAAQTFAYSPYITWALSHWNQLRLQYTYTDHKWLRPKPGLRPDDAVYLQWAWIIGSHAHGWQQR